MSLKYEQLIGRNFDWYSANCYTLVRDFYRDNFAIELTDYACPTDWWRHGMSLYNDFYFDEGFRAIDCNPRDYLPGDVIMMAEQSKVANHLGVLLDDGYILHHLPGGLSKTDPYLAGGFWRSKTLGVVRHKDVTYKKVAGQGDLMELLPAHVRARLANRRSPPDA